MSGESDRSGVAKRRRERRLRQFLRHERLTVAMALAENFHHSRQKVEGGEHGGLRAQKTARATGVRPGVLEEPEPQGGAGMVGYMPASVPRLQGHRLQGDDGVDGSGVDGSSLRYLLGKILVRKKEEEEEQWEVLRKFSESHTRWQEGGAASSRRRKKRKKKVPKTRRRPLPQLVACRSTRVGVRIRRREHGFALALHGSGARVFVACVIPSTWIRPGLCVRSPWFWCSHIFPNVVSSARIRPGFRFRSSWFWCSFVVLAVFCSVSCCSPEEYSCADSGRSLPEWFPYSSHWFDNGAFLTPREENAASSLLFNS